MQKAKIKMQNDRAKYMTNPKHEIPNAKQNPISKFKMPSVLSIGVSVIRFLREGRAAIPGDPEGEDESRHYMNNLKG